MIAWRITAFLCVCMLAHGQDPIPEDEQGGDPPPVEEEAPPPDDEQETSGDEETPEPAKGTDETDQGGGDDTTGSGAGDVGSGETDPPAGTEQGSGEAEEGSETPAAGGEETEATTDPPVSPTTPTGPPTTPPTAKGDDASSEPATADPGVEVPDPAVASGAAEAATPTLEILSPLSAAGLDGRFREIEAAYPTRALARMLPCGTPDAPAETPLLILGDRTGAGERAGGDATGRPGLAFYGFGDDATVHAALAVADELLARGASADAGEDPLARATLYLLPSLPSSGSPGLPVAPRNFPVGWRPETIIPGSGPYPLAASGSRALAEFLNGLESLVLLLALEDGPCTGPEVDGIFADGLRLEMARMQGELEGPARISLAPSSLCPATAASYAWAARGVFPARVVEPPLLDPLAGQLARGRAGAIVAAIEALPRLTIDGSTVTTLRPGQVRVDVEIRNAGLLPTRSASGAGFGLPGAVELVVDGARVLACAAGPAGGTPNVRDERGGRFPLGDIAGGETLSVCLVLAAEPGAQVTLACDASRAGRATTLVTIP